MNIQNILELVQDLDREQLSKFKCIEVFQNLDQIEYTLDQLLINNNQNVLQAIQTLLRIINQTLDQLSESNLLYLCVLQKIIGILLKQIKKDNFQGCESKHLKMISIKLRGVVFNIVESQLCSIFESTKISYFHVFVQTWKMFSQQFWKMLMILDQDENFQFIGEGIVLYMIEQEIQQNNSAICKINIMRQQFLFVIFNNMNEESFNNFWQFLKQLMNQSDENQVQSLIILFTICQHSNCRKSSDWDQNESLMDVVKTLTKLKFYKTLKHFISQFLEHFPDKEPLVCQILNTFLTSFNDQMKNQIHQNIILDFLYIQITFSILIIKNHKLSNQLYKKNLTFFSKLNASGQTYLINQFLRIQNELYQNIQQEELGQYLKQVAIQVSDSNKAPQIDLIIYCKQAFSILKENSGCIYAQENDLSNLCIELLNRTVKDRNDLNIQITEKFIMNKWNKQQNSTKFQEKIENFQTKQNLEKITHQIKQTINIFGVKEKYKCELYNIFLMDQLKSE